MMTIVLFVVCVFMVLYGRMCRRLAKLPKLPPVRPGMLPIIGHTHFLLTDTKNLWQFLKSSSEMCQKIGGVICSKIAGDLYYMVTDPEDVSTAAYACLQKHFLYDFLKHWLGEGLVTARAETHRHHRKLLNPGFTMSVMHGFLDVFNSQARELTTSLESCIDQTTDPLPHFKKITLRTSCLTTFGSKIKNEDLEKYASAADEIMFLITQRSQTFYLQVDLIYKLLGYQKKEDAVLRILNSMTDEAMNNNKKDMMNGNIVENKCDVTDQDVLYKPFINFLLELSVKGLLTEKEVRDHTATNIAASFETTAYTLLIVTVLLGSYPEVQEKMYEEFINVLGADRDVDKDDLPKLSYTRAVIKESLRVIPVAPILPRYVDKEVQLKNYTMRANSQLIICVWSLHRHENWGDDTDQFKPERWLDTTVPPKNFAGFGIGRRSCIGMKYALTSITVTLAHLVRKYRWTADVTKMQMKLDITLKPISGSEITFQKRNK